MKLREIVLKNFKGYYNETRIPVDDLTALIGQNDVGKSTILAVSLFYRRKRCGGRVFSAIALHFALGKHSIVCS